MFLFKGNELDVPPAADCFIISFKIPGGILEFCLPRRGYGAELLTQPCFMFASQSGARWQQRCVPSRS